MSSEQKKSLTLSLGLVSPKKTLEISSCLLPWEVEGYAEDFSNAKTQGGIFDLTDHVILQIQGKDAQDYLQRMTTVQFKTLDESRVVHGAFLTGRGGVVVLGVFRKVGPETFHFIVSQDKKEKALEHIEQFHFAEQFSVRDLSKELSILGLWSEDGALARRFKLEPHLDNLKIQKGNQDGSEFEAWKDVRRNELFWMVFQSEQALEFLKKWPTIKHIMLGRRLFEFFRLKAGIPWAGNELSEKDIVLEGNFDEAVARNKGCYPGQEVVERIFTYGQVNRKLQRVTLWGEIPNLSRTHIPFFVNGKEAGELVSFEQSPVNDNETIGLMFVKKEYWGTLEELVSPGGWRAKLFI
jgi:folate-binding protein YgfZ